MSLCSCVPRGQRSKWGWRGACCSCRHPAPCDLCGVRYPISALRSDVESSAAPVHAASGRIRACPLVRPSPSFRVLRCPRSRKRRRPTARRWRQGSMRGGQAGARFLVSRPRPIPLNRSTFSTSASLRRPPRRRRVSARGCAVSTSAAMSPRRPSGLASPRSCGRPRDGRRGGRVR